METGRRTGASPARSMSTARPASGISRRRDVVVLAANGVGTPRLLLALRQPRQRLGPGRPQPAAPHAGRRRDLGRRAARIAHRLRRRADRRSSPRPTPAAASSTASTSTASPRRPPASQRSACSPRRARPGGGPSQMVRAPLRPRLRRLRHRRRSAQPEQPRDARSRPRGCRRRAGSAEVSYPPRRERPADDALHARAPRGHRQGGRRLRVPAAGLCRRRRRLPHAGLAPARHLPHGRRPGDVGGQQVAPGLGRAQPLHRRRQRARDRRRGEPDLDDLRAGAARRRHLRDNFAELSRTTRAA